MPTAPDPITSPPAVTGQPWDATSKASVDRWESVDGEAGTVSFETGHSTGDHFADPTGQSNSRGPWKQT